MRKLFMLFCLLFTVPVLFTQPAPAQETHAEAPEAHYHLEFIVRELGEDGKVVNSRVYRTDMSTKSLSSIRTGTRIPVHVSSKEGDIQYLDVGVNIDCNRAHETAQGLAMEITTEVSSLASPSGVAEPTTPIIRQNRWMSSTVVPFGKPTILFSSDNLENKGKLQVELTATPIH
jgi:hypothetical protein